MINLPPWFVLQPVTENDIIIASIALGFTLGFGLLTTWTATRQTWVAYKRTGRMVLHNVYIRMVWGEIIVCLVFSVMCFMHLRGKISPCFGFYFSILTVWALQVHFLLQIIINRCRIIAQNKCFMQKLKIGVAILICLVNVSVYNIWIPARMQIAPSYIHVNEWWDRCEKVIYMFTDAFLNIYFIRVVQLGLVRNGLTKYQGLVRFNMFIIGFSLSMDLLIITMMSLPNTFVYMQFHPLAYIVKLNIELSMADLIGRIARSRDNQEFFGSTTTTTSSDSRKFRRSRSFVDRWHSIGLGSANHKSGIHTDEIAFNDITRPDTAYTVNATTNNGIESVRPSRDIYTTREFRVDFEDSNSQSHCDDKVSSHARCYVSGTPRQSREDKSVSRSDRDDYVITDDTPV
ncbi:hypothetical protein F4808DRAFT_469404 [Astrocystis sublimbata]|nr:hypothetical protein F4808DRAFT_469404 [Astrocystis sublimbata]